MHFIYSFVISFFLMWCMCSQSQPDQPHQPTSQKGTTSKDSSETTKTTMKVSPDSTKHKNISAKKSQRPPSKNPILESAHNNNKFNAKKWLASDRSFPSALHPGRISRYDGLIKKMARRYGFDWRLIAAQIYVESTFDTSATSHAGAQGLMQIMPGTSRYLGYDPSLMHDPKVNIAVGCLYDHKLYTQWKKEHQNKEQRLAFALASFNAGRSRVLRAYRHNDSIKNWTTAHTHLPTETQNYVHKIALKHHTYSRFVLP